MSAYSPKEYWAGVAENFHSADAAGFAPVLHPDAPEWFNRLIDKLQFRAMKRAILLAGLPANARILDVGCGTGRWLRRYQDIGFRPAGVDRTPGMLQVARKQGTTAPFAAADAANLPFADGTFDCVSDVTVVQHMPSESQLNAIREMIRVLKPGGRLILVELIRGQDAHIFPRTPEDWIQQVNSCGMTLIGWFGQEFLLLDRIFVAMVQAVTALNRDRKPENAAPERIVSRERSAVQRAYWQLRRITASLGAWTDPITEKISPGSLATHGVFVFRK